MKKRHKKSKKASPKKASPKKASPKKASPKKASPKKASPKKASPKKAPPKKASPKKAPPKKAPPKKAPPKKAPPKTAPPKKAPPPEKPFYQAVQEDIIALKAVIEPPARVYSHAHPGEAILLIIYPPLTDEASDRARMLRDADKLSSVPVAETWWIRAGVSVMVDRTENEDDYHKVGKFFQKDIYSMPRPLSEPGPALNALWGSGGIIDRNRENVLGHLLLELSSNPSGERPNR
jgi:hypothetical protein